MSNISTGTTVATAFQVTGDTTGQFVVQTGASATTAMTIDTSQNVGIGTSSPSSFYSEARNLVVGTGTGGQGMTIYAGTASQSRLMFADGTTGSDPYTGFVQYDHSSNALAFGTNGGTERMRIDSSGNVGIGTASPSAKLDVGGAIWSRPGVSTGAVAILTGDATSGANGISLSASFATGGYGPIIFNTSNTERMRIDASGNVGIGTASPGTKLNVYSSTAVNTFSRIQNSLSYVDSGPLSDGSIYGLYAAPAASTNMIIGNSNSNPLLFYTNAAERMRITEGGNVGIGTAGSSTVRTYIKGASATSSDWALYAENSTPAVLFFVRNDGLFRTGTQTFSPYNYTTGSAANVFVNTDGDLQRSTSSLRYKTDITDATHGLADVLKLRSVTYKGINDGDKIFGGLIAEEVHDAGLTEFVAYNDKGEPDALHYGNMIALLTKAIQELKAENDALKTRIEALESK